MATTTNYGWTTPDDTGLVKDGASAIRSLGTSVDTTTKNLNPSTTLGDIEYRSSTANTNTRLGIGSTGNVLTVAGGVPTWAAPASGQSYGSYSLLNSGGTSLSGSTTTISSISNMDKLLILVLGASASAVSKEFYVRFNSDTGSNYYTSGFKLAPTTTWNSESNMGSTGNTSNTFIRAFDSQSGSASADNNLSLSVDACRGTGIKTFTMIGAPNGNASNGYTTQGAYLGTSAISSVSIITTGTFDAGTVYVYGSAV